MLVLLVLLLCGSILASGISGRPPQQHPGGHCQRRPGKPVCAVCYVLLGAPDVAMTEASIGSGLSVLIFLYAIRRTSEDVP